MTRAGLRCVQLIKTTYIKSAFFKVVVASTVVLSDFYDHRQLPFGVQIHRPDRVPVTCLT
jgi:hypothetical protein